MGTSETVPPGGGNDASDGRDSPIAQGSVQDGERRHETGLVDLSPAASGRIRLFLATAIIRGGASPADIADLCTSPEIVDDRAATEYLDRRFVHGEVPHDWRDLQDHLATTYETAPPGTTTEELLARVHQQVSRARTQRSIFDDPEEEEVEEVDRLERMEGQTPRLLELTAEGRHSIERYVVADVLCYGVAPYRVMEMRADLSAAGDDRALQYLDLPWELGDRPADWNALRDRALMLRARLEARGIDPADAYSSANGEYPDLEAGEILSLLEERSTRR
ncbi:MAG: hypothetical protein IT305_14800 [Chloroflexi bacterium]|nr:hypothetical protein [Chloroflexota bacterium]